MFLIGTIVNAIAVAFGSLIGLVIPSIPERMKLTIMQGVALCVILIGATTAFADANDILVIIASVVVGALIGEWINIELWLERLGAFVEKRFKQKSGGGVAEGFVVASLVFCVGSMAIVGAFQDGFLGHHKVLFAKSLLDGFSSIIFASTLGVGVMLSAIPIFLYEGLIATASFLLGNVLNSPPIINCMSATGGLLIVGIGINLMEIKKVKVGNLLPAMFVAAVFKWATLFVQGHHWFGL